MHDILTYVSKDPVYRRWEHQHLTFSMLYACNENFVLPFSHDEVVHGKGSMMNKMPGDAWQKAATLRALYAFMYAHPGKKLLFMGGEFGQWREWNHDASLDWHLLGRAAARRAAAVRRGSERALPRTSRRSIEVDFEPAGFEWIDCNDHESSVISLIRRGARSATTGWSPCSTGRPSSRHGYRIGVPEPGYYAELLNSDACRLRRRQRRQRGRRSTPSRCPRTATRSRCA